MPPARRARGAHRAAPYSRGWLPRASRSSDDEEGPVPHDALSPVFARLPSAADVIRSAATCRRWARLVAKDAAVLSGVLPPLQCLTLGFFHQENAGGTARRRRASSADAQPCFVPTAAGARLIGLPGPSWTVLADAVLGLGDDRGLFEHARPVAARNGWLVLELRQERRHTDGLKLCVCNPTRGDLAMVPPLAGADNPGDYACALYTGHDLDTPRPLSSFFRLLIVYNRRAFTALRSYSSDTGRWSTEARRLWGPKIASEKLRKLGQSIVVGGVAYWRLKRTAFAVRMKTPEPAEVRMPQGGIADPPPGWGALGVAADGKLMYIDAGLAGYYKAAVRSEHIYMPKWAHFCPSTGDDCYSGAWQWTKGWCIRLKKQEWWRAGSQEQMLSPSAGKINLRWFFEKSGNELFTLGEGTGSPGAFIFNMATQDVEKVADGVDCHSWTNFVGYEMDWATYLACISRG